MSFVNVGDRTYMSNHGSFGDVVRTSFLGLQNAPVMMTDAGNLVGIAGPLASTSIYMASTGKNENNENISLPVDVKIVGIEQLNAHGLSAAIQGEMFAKWLGLTDEKRQEYLSQWTSVTASNDKVQLSSFLDAMKSALA